MGPPSFCFLSVWQKTFQNGVQIFVLPSLPTFRRRYWRLPSCSHNQPNKVMEPLPSWFTPPRISTQVQQAESTNRVISRTLSRPVRSVSPCNVNDPTFIGTILEYHWKSQHAMGNWGPRWWPDWWAGTKTSGARRWIREWPWCSKVWGPQNPCGSMILRKYPRFFLGRPTFLGFFNGT